MITPDDARQQAKALKDASDASPIIQVAVVLRERAREWERSASTLELAEEMGNDAQIILVGTAEPGMKVVSKTTDARVIRVLTQGGTISLQLFEEGFTKYENFISQTSPVVVVL